MPSLFTSNEYVDMLLIYGECGKKSRAAEEMYRERFPNRRVPSRQTFRNVERKMRTGSFPSPRGVLHARPARQEQNVINVLALIVINPHASVRSIAEEIGISKSSVHRILVDNGHHPYKICLVQDLRPNDYNRRMEFIANFMVQLHDDPLFVNKIMWTDESRFHNNGTVNRHNSHYWSVENPRWVRETHFQTIWGTNVWCGLFNGRLIGPYFYEGILNGERYLRFLRNIIPGLVEEIPINERLTMWWQQDGAPPHNSNLVTRFLTDRFGVNWIGNQGPVKWPARSPDMSPLDFFLWGHLKQVVYAEKPNNLNDLKNRITHACRQITPDVIRSSCTRELLRRYELCQIEYGRQFEHLL